MARLSKFEAVGAAGRRWVESALESDDSLFTPGVRIWSRRGLDEVRGRLGERAGEPLDLTWGNIESRFRDAQPAAIQLMAECLLPVARLHDRRRPAYGTTDLRAR